MENIKKDFETRFTGWAFILAALLLWFGWVLSPHHIGEYIVASDFTEVGKNVWYWIWMYRIHIFGWVTMGIALFAFVAATARKPYRVVILPGAGMTIIGTFTLAIASAYYYNHGAWGVGQTVGMSAEELEDFMYNLLFTNQYVTCFIRFGRIFSGVGLVLLGFALIKWKMVSTWLSWFTILLGFAAMSVILFIPDNFEIYKPLFHVKVVWLLAMGAVLLKQGIHLSESKS
ncbi:hypothetical protein [Tamlana flava]|uniref:hypothetical protein n=1 Tax=Tamlana flava TaxID=3158572 RepID=UPI00351BCF62